MNRRRLFSWFTERIGGGFLAGAVGGATAGSAVAYGAGAPEPWRKTSYSQQGEDLILESICLYLGIENPAYLDIGAADPIRLSNTYLFYQKGCRGVLVEPNPAQCRKPRATRPRDAVLNVGIGVSDQAAVDYYMIGGPGGEDLNTFSKEIAEAYAAKTGGRHALERVIKMPLVNINQVIEDHFPTAPDLVSVDAEGLDLEILKSLDFERRRAAVFCVETLAYGTKTLETDILVFMESKGYAVRGGGFVNTIFVDSRRLV